MSSEDPLFILYVCQRFITSLSLDLTRFHRPPDPPASPRVSYIPQVVISSALR
jgi:hypothetical protein